MENIEILKKIIRFYGVDSQLNVATEELAELIQSICKFRRYGTEKEELDILEEMADVEIMIEQLKVIFGLEQSAIDNMKDYKLSRQLRRIEEL